MPDPICRWRYFSVDNVRALLKLFPDERLGYEEGEAAVETQWPGWSHTAYQLAAQVGLVRREGPDFEYHRYLHFLSDDGWAAYMRFWLRTYPIPNPYVRGFNQEPVVLYARVVQALLDSEDRRLVWGDLIEGILGETIGNKDALYKAFIYHGAPLKFSTNTYQDGAEVWMEEDDEPFFAAYLELAGRWELPKREDKDGFFRLFSAEKFRLFWRLEGAVPGGDEMPGLASFSEAFTTALDAAKIVCPDDLVRRVIAALLSRPFLILTGLSGSGKTLLAQAFSKWISPLPDKGDEQPEYALVAVGANWASKDDLLGYPDALTPGTFVARPALGLVQSAQENWKAARRGDPGVVLRPHFLILDEMNLSHVERYFSDFLSALESGEEIELHEQTFIEEHPAEDGSTNRVAVQWLDPPPRLRLPPNLFVIGTVNVDETTYMFSPKVLDRANVIEFRATGTYAVARILGPAAQQAQLEELMALENSGDAYGPRLVHDAMRKFGENLRLKDSETAEQEIQLLFETLADHEAEFGFRSTLAMGRFVAFYAELSASTEDPAEVEEGWQKRAFDAQILQKILPKMHGSKRKLGPVLRALAACCLEGTAATRAELAKLAAGNKHGDADPCRGQEPDDVRQRLKDYNDEIHQQIRYPLS